MSVKISSLEVENVKRVKAVKLEPSANGLTVIGGNNGQGKTSVLDAIAWALGGDRFAPSSPKRAGSTIPPHLIVKLNNGIIVERKGKNSDLMIDDFIHYRTARHLRQQEVDYRQLHGRRQRANAGYSSPRMLPRDC